MTITLTSDIEKAIVEVATRQGISPEKVVLDTLQETLQARSQELAKALEPRDEWEARLLRIGTPCGVVPSREALTSEGLYD
jgi:hypothetical protein